MTTHILQFKRDTFDQENTFPFAFQGRKGEQVRRGYAKDFGEEGCFIMQEATCLKDHYTDKDREESARIAAMLPVRSGDTVNIDGKTYTVKILGDYSDAGRLIPA